MYYIILYYILFYYIILYYFILYYIMYIYIYMCVCVFLCWLNTHCDGIFSSLKFSGGVVAEI